MNSALFERRASQQTIAGTVRVAAGHWEKGQGSDVLYTREIGACIGVAIYDTAARIGHMAHVYSTEGSQLAVIGGVVDSIRLNSTDSSSLIGWVSGGSSEAKMPDWLDPDVLLRSKAIARLGQLGLDPMMKNLQVDWNNDERLLVGMSLNCATGDYVPTKSHNADGA
ncbi:MAG: hypothetical protein ACR2FM_03575 [Candidatus Saccharimonadales bacterium]